MRCTKLRPPRWNPPQRGKGAYLTKRFQPVHQQEELVGTMLLHPSQGLDSKLKSLDKSNLLIFSIFSSIFGFLSGPTYILYRYISYFRRVQYIMSLFLQFVGCRSLSLEVKWHFKKRTWRNLAEAPRIIVTTQDRWSVPSSMSQACCRWKNPLRWKSINTHTPSLQCFYKQCPYIVRLICNWRR